MTEITCTRCDSRVAWAPFCSRCGAYLEFSGDPPWHPDSLEPQGETTEIASPNEFESSHEVSVTEEIPVFLSVSHHQQVPPAAVLSHDVDAHHAPSARSQSPLRRLAWGILGFALGMCIALMLGYVASWWIAGTFVIVCAVWIVALWPSRASQVSDNHGSGAVNEEILEVTETTALVEVAVTAVEPSAIEARAPQVIPRRALEMPAQTATSEVIGEIPCSVCGQLNERGLHYCISCGGVLVGVEVEPKTAGVDADGSEQAQSESPEHRRRVSRSWRTPIIVGILFSVFLASVIFAAFGPYAFRIRYSTAQFFSYVNQFIDPLSGNEADIESATASSSLRGTTPKEAAGNDAAAFWASEPLPNYGAGSELTFTFDQPYAINRAVILPGIQNGQFDPRAVATPAQITLTFDDGSSVTDTLNLIQSQRDYRQLVRFPQLTTQVVRLRIDSVYPPRIRPEEPIGEVALAGAYFLEPPGLPISLNVPTGISDPAGLPGTVN